MLKLTGFLATLLLAVAAFADDGPITGMKVDLDELVRVGRVLPVQGMSSSGAPDEAARRADLWVEDPDGFLAMQGEVEWE